MAEVRVNRLDHFLRRDSQFRVHFYLRGVFWKGEQLNTVYSQVLARCQKLGLQVDILQMLNKNVETVDFAVGLRENTQAAQFLESDQGFQLKQRKGETKIKPQISTAFALYLQEKGLNSIISQPVSSKIQERDTVKVFLLGVPIEVSEPHLISILNKQLKGSFVEAEDVVVCRDDLTDYFEVALPVHMAEQFLELRLQIEGQPILKFEEDTHLTFAQKLKRHQVKVEVLDSISERAILQKLQRLGTLCFLMVVDREGRCLYAVYGQVPIMEQQAGLLFSAFPEVMPVPRPRKQLILERPD